MKYFKLKRNGQNEAGNVSALMNFRPQAIAILCVVFTALSFVPSLISHAQGLYVPVKVSSISSQTSPSGSLVTIAADNTLSRPQTWQDEEGFHVVLPNTVSMDSMKPARGVKVRRIGSSLEILAQTKPGTRVSLSSAHNQLSLVIDGKIGGRPPEVANSSPSNETGQNNFSTPGMYRVKPESGLKLSAGNDTGVNAPAPATSQLANSQTASLPTIQNPAQVSSGQPALQGTAVQVQPEADGVLSSVFSGTSVLIVFALGLFGLLVSRKVRLKREVVSTAVVEDLEDCETAAGDLSPANEPGTSLVRTGETAMRSSRQSATRATVAGPTSLFGAYRIDQEVGKLLLGQPHRIDVLASRAVDDRRAIETSLIKGVNSSECDENAQRRAREALEEYGFVARQCAALLLASEAFERSSAARALGEIQSAAALPFLLEALYDSEAIVRNQAVVSIGELKLPSAIGALLDIARTHPDVPSSLLSRTLSACSLEGLDFFDAIPVDSSLLGPGDVGSIIQEITHLEPSSPVESLPEESDDPALADALYSVVSSDVEERAEALKILVQFRVQSAVDAIAKVARRDPQSTIRSLAISSLGTINHESVFAAVLIGMADDSREVRAAAARSVSRLSFDRADAYVRVIETSDPETLGMVAQACIRAGIISQNLDRLTNVDHRQAYETFSLICLLTKAGMNEPVLEAISDHPRVDVRLKAIHLLGCCGEPAVFDQLRELAVKEGIGEVVKTALLEAMYKLDQNRLKEDNIIDELDGPKTLPELEPIESPTAVVPQKFEIPTAEDFEQELDSAFGFKGLEKVDEPGM